MPLTYNQVSFKILSYVCYLHQAKSLLRLISRTAFIMTFDEPMFTQFTKFEIELPYSYHNQFVYESNLIARKYKVSSKIKSLGNDMKDVKCIRICSNVLNLSKHTPSLTRLATPIGCNSNLSDLDECHDLI